MRSPHHSINFLARVLAKALNLLFLIFFFLVGLLKKCSNFSIFCFWSFELFYWLFLLVNFIYENISAQIFRPKFFGPNFFRPNFFGPNFFSAQFFFGPFFFRPKFFFSPIFFRPNFFSAQFFLTQFFSAQFFLCPIF